MIWCYNFMAQFAPAVESGGKRQTVRRERKDGRVPKVGDTVKLYQGLRTRNARLLRPPTAITLVESIVITPADRTIVIDGLPLDEQEMCEFAMRDGFRDGPAPSYEFFDFFRTTSPGYLGWTRGVVVHWSAL